MRAVAQLGWRQRCPYACICHVSISSVHAGGVSGAGTEAHCPVQLRQQVLVECVTSLCDHRRGLREGHPESWAKSGP